MKTTKTQKFMLYSLGKWFEEANKKIKKPLEVSISKSIFIDVVKKSRIAKKQERALYKNLEVLEKKKLVSYKHKRLELTQKGKKLYKETNEHIKPYFVLYKKLKEKNPASYTKKIQTVLR